MAITASLEQRVEDILSSMTLAEKIGQMTQVEKNSITPEEVANHFIGSVLSGGGGYPTPNTPESWRSMVVGFQQAALSTRLRIPIMYGVDAVHGNNNIVGATIFPHNIGLGASGDEELVAKSARVTALELLSSAIHWDFAPCVAVPQDIRWGRTYEGFGQDTQLVSRLGRAYLLGLQNAGNDLSHPHSVLGSAKHFVGDGGAAWGTSPRFGADWTPELWGEGDRTFGIDQGVTGGDEAFLRKVFLPPYIEAIAAGARNIMVSYTSWGDLKMHAQKYLLTDVLKGELGFTGFLVSDWNAIDQIHADYYTCVVAAINAGMDMIMVPFKYKIFIETLTRAVENGVVSISRIDDAVRRILRVKLEMDLFNRPFGDESLLSRVGCPEHRAIAREAVRHSLVLLKNDNDNVLPLSKNVSSIFLSGLADDLGSQCGGWTVEWQGKKGNHIPGTTLLQALQQLQIANLQYSATGEFPENIGMAEIGIAVLAEPPYAEGIGDRADLCLTGDEIALLERLRTRCEKLIVILYSGRPLIINAALPLADVFIAAWLPGSEGEGITDVLFGDYPFTGRLSFAWPRSMEQVPYSALQKSGEPPLFPIGFGL
jgi:beta-glucosidase